MNRTQMEYARDRLDREFTNKAKTIQAACVIKPERKPPTLGEFLKLFKAGKVKERTDFYSNYTLRRDTHIGDLWDTTELLSKCDAKVNEKEYNRRRLVLEAHHTKAMDELMLGDEKAALALINAFVAKEF